MNNYIKDLTLEELALYKRALNTSEFHPNNRYATYCGRCLFSTAERPDLLFVEGCNRYFKTVIDRENYVKSQ